MTGIAGALDRLAAAINRIVVVAAAAMAVVMIGSLCLEVFFRYGLRRSLPWSEELALLLFTWVVLLFGSVGVREGFHVRVSLLVDYLPEIPRAIFDRLTLAAIVLFGLLMAHAGWEMVARNWDQVSPATRYPLPLLYAAVPAMGVLIAFHGIVLAVQPRAAKLGGQDSLE